MSGCEAFNWPSEGIKVYALPCPYCGSTDLYVNPHDGFECVICRDCNAHGPDLWWTQEELVEQMVATWNKRATSSG